jgi:hypothetical protein
VADRTRWFPVLPWLAGLGAPCDFEGRILCHSVGRHLLAERT